MPKPFNADNGTFLKAAKIKFVKTARCFILKSNKVGEADQKLCYGFNNLNSFKALCCKCCTNYLLIS